MAKALLNPSRIRILNALSEGPASPKQLATIIGKSLSIASYHLEVLREADCVALEPEQEGLVADRLYELTPGATPTRRLGQPAFDPERSPVGPGHPSASVLQRIVEAGSGGLPGAFDARQGDHLSCISIVLDRQGQQEVSAAIGDALDRVASAHAQSMERLAKAGGKGVDATVAMASFETPRVA